MAGKREEQLKEITERLEQGVAEFFNSEHYAEYLKTMSKFHTYSFNNTLLIALQKPDATLVAGYQAWQSKFNRHVKRGEKGIKIIAPVPVREKELREKRDELTDEVVLRPDGEPEMEEVTHIIPRFRVTTVFDVGQTDGDPMPDLGVEDLTAGVENYDIFMEAVTRISPVPIRFDEIGSGAKGYYSSADKEIVIQSGMSQSQTLKTAIHETAHAKLHDMDYMSEEGIRKDQMTREVEAESVAYTVCQQFGIDTSEYSFPYVASWSSGKSMPELRSSMDTIRHTSSDFIDEMTGQINLIREEGKTKYEIIYDFCDEFSDEHGIVESFTGDWHELQEEIKQMRANGCYNITATALETDELHPDPEQDVLPNESSHDSAECPKKSVLEALRECRDELKGQEKQTGYKPRQCGKGEPAI